MTLFKDDIYEMNELIRNDNRLNLKPTNQIYKIYFDYLKYAIGKFYRKCYKDLTDRVNFSQTEYFFISNGTDNNYQLSTTPPSGCLFYVGYTEDKLTAYTEVNQTDYTFNAATNVLTITSSLIPQNYIVYIVPYVIGNFNFDCDLDEINILIEAMNIPFLEEQQNRNSLLTQFVQGGSTHLSGTQANHISAVSNVVKDQIKKVDDMIYNYSFQAAPDKLRSLGGEGNL